MKVFTFKKKFLNRIKKLKINSNMKASNFQRLFFFIKFGILKLQFDNKCWYIY